MSNQITKLEPANVWNYFYQITQIPRPSGYEKEIAQFIVNFAKERQLEAIVDEVGNVIVNVPATEDKLDAPLVILQGHMDMVPVVEDGFEHDFLKTPIDAYVDNDFVKAHHTTLGADNGIAIAMSLALVDDKTLSHGPLRLIFTVEEETSMKGASNLDKKYLEGATYLVNLDSEDDGFLFVNCAGSADVTIKLNTPKVEAEDVSFFKLELSHLSGGHSGADIHLGHANAIKLLANILNNLDVDLFVGSINGGSVRNAIPSKASVVLAIANDEKQFFIESLNKEFELQKAIYHTTDSNMLYTLEECPAQKLLGLAQSLDLIHLLCALPSGIDRLSPEFEGIVETSINLGTIKTTDSQIIIGMMARSLKDEGLNDIIAKVNAISDLLDETEMSAENFHAPWSSPAKNRLIDVLNESYEAITGNKFKVTALHAGVECAQFAKLNPALQLISIGPTILNPHSPSERLGINGTKQIYETVFKALKAL